MKLGQVSATPGALAALEQSGEQPGEFLARTPRRLGKPVCRRSKRKRVFSGARFQAALVLQTAHWHGDLGHNGSRPQHHLLLPCEY